MYSTLSCCVLLVVVVLWTTVDGKGMRGFENLNGKRSNDPVVITLNDGETEREEIVMRMSINPTKYPDLTFYRNEKRDVYCVQNDNTARCTLHAGEMSHFFSENHVVSIANKPGTIEGINFNHYYAGGQEERRRFVNELENLQKQSLSKRQTPATDPGTVRLQIHPDKYFLYQFRNATIVTPEQMKTEAQLYIATMVTQVADVYSTLQGQNTFFDWYGTERQLVLTVNLVDVIYPEVNSNGSDFINHGWSEDNVLDAYSMVYGYGFSRGNRFHFGALIDFSKYVNENQSSTVFDSAIAVTGLSIVYQRRQYTNDGDYIVKVQQNGTIGVAWFESTCQHNFGKYAFDKSTGMSMRYGEMYKIVAHEIGHNLGSNHDGSGCPNGQYVMSSYYTTNANSATFSSCSALNIADYLSGVGSSAKPNCLWTS